MADVFRLMTRDGPYVVIDHVVRRGKKGGGEELGRIVGEVLDTSKINGTFNSDGEIETTWLPDAQEFSGLKPGYHYVVASGAYPQLFFVLPYSKNVERLPNSRHQ